MALRQQPTSLADAHAVATMLLREIEPHLDAIVCYASSTTEHPPNDLVVRVRQYLGVPSAGDSEYLSWLKLLEQSARCYNCGELLPAGCGGLFLDQESCELRS